MNSVQAKQSALEGLRFYYQDIGLNRYKAAKESLVSSCEGIVEAIIACFQSRYGSLESVGRENQTDSISAREGDTIIYHACKVLNTKAWFIADNEPQEAALSSIMESITFLHEHYQAMSSLQDITSDDVKTKCICLVEYALRYNTSEMDCLKLWSFLKQVGLADRWSSAFLLVELCLCSPYSNGTVERLFSQMKVVKTDWRNRLNKRNLEDLLRTKISNVSLSKFSKKFADCTLTIWASKKQCCLSKENANIVRELQQVQRSLSCEPWLGFYKRMLTINERCS